MLLKRIKMTANGIGVPSIKADLMHPYLNLQKQKNKIQAHTFFA